MSNMWIFSLVIIGIWYVGHSVGGPQGGVSQRNSACKEECVQQKNTNYLGNDIKNKQISKPSNANGRSGGGKQVECATWCGTTQGCNFWAFRSSDNWCWLKSAKTNTFTTAGITSGNKACGIETDDDSAPICGGNGGAGAGAGTGGGTGCVGSGGEDNDPLCGGNGAGTGGGNDCVSSGDEDSAPICGGNGGAGAGAGTGGGAGAGNGGKGPGTGGGGNCKTKCVTVGGGETGAACVFPFIFKNNIYTTCPIHPDDKKPWCSTMVDKQGVHVQGQGKWGHCGAGCNPDTDLTRSSCNEDGDENNGDGDDCKCSDVIKQDHNGKEIGACLTQFSGKHWCYVPADSKCSDKKESSRETGLFWSASACIDYDGAPING